MVIFDFDGTLLDSNDIKKNCFYETLGDSKSSHDIMDDVLHDASGDRYTIWRNFILKKGHTSNIDDNALYLAERYSKILKKKLSQASPMEGAVSLLRWLKTNKINISLSSATPVVHLYETIEALDWSHYFTNIFGSPQSKIESLKYIEWKHKLNKTNMIVVGDGADDLESALDFGCEFLPVHEARGLHDGAKTYNLLEIIDFIKKRQKASEDK